MTTEQAVRLYMAFFNGFESVGNTLSERLKDTKFYSELLVDTVEKQIPKKPKITVHKCRKEDSSKFADYKFTHCPCCFDNAEIGYFDSLLDKGTKYCYRCGQRIDWSDDESD